MQNLVTIGILSYKDKKYLQQALPSLLAQAYSNIEILVCDNNEDPANEIANWVAQEFPTVKVLNAGGNVGFGNGHNHLINNAKGDFYLCFNSDMYASKDYVEKLLSPFSENPKLAVVTGKIYKWSNFPENPTAITRNYFDTLGLIAYQNHSFQERGHAQKDIGQFETLESIWGCSGASPMFNLKLLRNVQHDQGEFFDSNFFMYKEDIDLMYRLKWAGYECLYQPTAIAWHDRTAEDPGGVIENIKKRRERSIYIKENSFLNHLCLVYKNWSSDYSLMTHLKTGLFLLKYNLYLLIFDPKVLKVYTKFNKILPNLRQKKLSMPRAITAAEMEKWFY